MVSIINTLKLLFFSIQHSTFNIGFERTFHSDSTYL